MSDAGSFLLVGIAATLVWLALEKRLWTSLRGVVGLVFVFVAVFLVWRILAQPTSLGSGLWYNSTPGRELILFFLTILGMTFQTLAAAVKERKGTLAKLREVDPVAAPPPIRLDRWDFALPLFIAVPTFFALLSQVNGQTIGPLTLSMAFQNGFMWRAILKESA